jgi:hypothetical protein
MGYLQHGQYCTTRSVLSMSCMELLKPSILSSFIFWPFKFFFSVSTIFAVWKVEISFTSYLQNHTCERTFHSHKYVYSFLLIFFSLKFLHFKSHSCTHCSQGKISNLSTNFMTASSHYITILDFLLWWCLKDYVYRNCVNNTSTLHARIIKAIQTVTKGMLTHTQAELEYHLDVIKAAKGSHVKAD